MFVNEYMLNMLSKNVLGIPIVVKLGKKDNVKSVYSIPYKQVAQYLGNIRGDFIGTGYAVKSVSLERLIEYSNNFNMNDWYSVEAVKIFFDINVEDDIDKNIIAWYNPYMKKIVCLTDAYKNPIEKPQSVSDEVLKKYFLKNGSDINFFVNIPSDISNSDACYDAKKFFVTRSGIAKQISFVKKHLEPFISGYCHNDLAISYLTTIDSIPVNRFMEATLLAVMEKSICLSYALSDNDQFSRYASYSAEELHRMEHLTRMRVALDLFYKNSILAFKALLSAYGDVNSFCIGKKILKNHFSQASNDSSWLAYTDSLYRIIALCVGFCSSNTDICMRAKTGMISVFPYHPNSRCTSNVLDAMIGTNKAFLASWFCTSFCKENYPQLPVLDEMPKYAYRVLTDFVTETLRLLGMSAYVASNGDVVAYYRKGKEFYDYAKL